MNALAFAIVPFKHADLIQPHACTEPSYGKIHLGVFITAVKEVINRAKQDAVHDLNDGGPSEGTDHKVVFEGHAATISNSPRGYVSCPRHTCD